MHQSKSRFYLAILSIFILLVSFNLIGCSSSGGGSGGGGGGDDNDNDSTPKSYAYVANSDDDNVGRINLKDNTYKTVEIEGRTIEVGDGPYGVAVSPGNEHVLVTNRNSGSCSVISVFQQKTVATYTNLESPACVSYSPNGGLAAIASYGNGIVWLLNNVSGGWHKVSVGGNPFATGFSPNNTRAYISNHADRSISVVKLDSLDYPIIATINNAGDSGIDVDINNNYIYVADSTNGQLIRISTDDYTDIRRIDVGAQPIGVACSPKDANLVYVANSGSNTVSVISSGVLKENITVGEKPLFIAFSADGQHAYVTNNGSNSVSVINVSNGTVSATIGTGHGPTGIDTTPF